MNYTYKNCSINYEIIGNGDTHFVFLHGWGGSIESFKFIIKYLKGNFSALFIDFPPFGKSEEPQIPFTMMDYANLTLDIIKQNGCKNCILVGHSFGGRVATILASSSICKKLVLVDSAGLKPKRSLKYHLKVLHNKICKKFGSKKPRGSADYKNLSPIMKKTFVNIVTTHLEKYCKQITIPTLIFWGEKDDQTPLYMAKKYKKLINNSELILYKNSGHFAYLENLSSFVATLNYFVYN